MVYFVDLKHWPIPSLFGDNFFIENDNLLAVTSKIFVGSYQPIKLAMVLSNSIVFPDRISSQNLRRPTIILLPEPLPHKINKYSIISINKMEEELMNEVIMIDRTNFWQFDHNLN